MRYDMRVEFAGGGVMTGDGTDHDGLTQLAQLLQAKADDRPATIQIEGGRIKSTDDIRSVRIEAVF